MRRWRRILGRENHVCKGPELRESRGHTVKLKTSGIEDTLRWRETYEIKLLRAARAEAKRLTERREVSSVWLFVFEKAQMT